MLSYARWLSAVGLLALVAASCDSAAPSASGSDDSGMVYYCFEFYDQAWHAHGSFNQLLAQTVGRQRGVCGSAAVPGLIRTGMIANYSDGSTSYWCYGIDPSSFAWRTNSGASPAAHTITSVFGTTGSGDAPPCGDGLYATIGLHRGGFYPSGEEGVNKSSPAAGTHDNFV